MASIERITNAVKELFCELFCEEDFDPKKTFSEMGLDTIDSMEIVLALEDEFDIFIDEGQFDVIFDMDNLTPQKLIDIVAQLTSAIH